MVTRQPAIENIPPPPTPRTPSCDVPFNVRISAYIRNQHARASINPCDERELDLRGYKIPMIENLGVSKRPSRTEPGGREGGDAESGEGEGGVSGDDRR